MVSRLEKYAIFNRTKKYRSTTQPNIFASAAARDNAFKQFQQSLEHAVEDVLDRHDQMEMRLPSSANLITPLDRIEEASETSSHPGRDPTLDVSVLNEEPKSDDFDPINADNDGVVPVPSDIDDSTFAESVTETVITQVTNDPTLDKQDDKPSSKLFFPVQNSVDDANSGSPISGSEAKMKEVQDSEESDKNEETVVSNASSTPGSSMSSDISTLSDKIRQQVNLNQQLRYIHGISFNNVPSSEDGIGDSLSQPPAMSFLQSPAARESSSDLSQKSILQTSDVSSLSKSSGSSKKSVSWSESLVQEPLSDSSAGTHNSIENQPEYAMLQDNVEQNLSSTLTQHTLTSSEGASPNFSRSTPIEKTSRSTSSVFMHNMSQKSPVFIERLADDSSSSSLHSKNITTSSRGSSSSSLSIGSGLANLQNQLMRINSHLKEIQAIKEQDDIAFTST